jgi:uncharacterized protein YkwD
MTKTKRSARRTRFCPALDRLDSRTLPTAGVTASLVGGILTVTGTEGNDRVTIDVSGPSRFRRSWNPASLTVEGVGSYRLNQIAAVVVFTGDGDDVVQVNDRGRLAAPVFINSGNGNDVVAGGYGKAFIDTGDGNDIIGTFNYSDVINGGTGLNWINGTLAYVPPPTSTPAVEASLAQAPSTLTNSAPPIAPTQVYVPPPASPSTPDLQSWAQQIISLTNQQRAANGLAPLSVSTQLTQEAQIQANQMASLRDMNHTLPQAQYPTLQNRAAAVGYSYSWLGENIAFNYSSPQTVMNAWMQSTEHRANILESNFTQIGVSVALDANGLPYFAQEFGRPA